MAGRGDAVIRTSRRAFLLFNKLGGGATKEINL